MREATVNRKTNETGISMTLRVGASHFASFDIRRRPICDFSINGELPTELGVETGKRKGETPRETGLGFFKHMLEILARHAGLEIVGSATGDLHVDDHHLVEDVGIVLGKALTQALGKKEGISRYGWAVVPMDESLVMCAVDLGGRAYLSYDLKVPAKRVKNFDCELVEEFFRAVSNSGAMNIHLKQLAGKNSHHIIEAGFKAFAQALKQAVALTGRDGAVPSTKGVL